MAVAGGSGFAYLISSGNEAVTDMSEFVRYMVCDPRVRVIAPKTLIPVDIERMGVEVFHDMAAGIKDCDIVMMLRLQTERMQGSFVPSTREYFHFYGLDYDKLSVAKPDALIMHPGPMNRGVEIDSAVADDITRSIILDQVELGVAVRQACLDALSRNLPWAGANA